MRVFAALPLPDQAVEKLGKLAAELKARYPDLKAVKPHGMHITMVFFGELNQEQILAVMRAMDSPELKLASIQAVMGGVGQFPPKGQPRVIYCPIQKGGPEIGYLYRVYYRLISGVEGLSLEGERHRSLGGGGAVSIRVFPDSGQARSVPVDSSASGCRIQGHENSCVGVGLRRCER
jgi:hypothetical protein